MRWAQEVTGGFTLGPCGIGGAAGDVVFEIERRTNLIGML